MTLTTPSAEAKNADGTFLSLRYFAEVSMFSFFVTPLPKAKITENTKGVRISVRKRMPHSISRALRINSKILEKILPILSTRLPKSFSKTRSESISSGSTIARMSRPATRPRMKGKSFFFFPFFTLSLRRSLKLLCIDEAGMKICSIGRKSSHHTTSSRKKMLPGE